MINIEKTGVNSIRIKDKNRFGMIIYEKYF